MLPILNAGSKHPPRVSELVKSIADDRTRVRYSITFVLLNRGLRYAGQIKLPHLYSMCISFCGLQQFRWATTNIYYMGSVEKGSHALLPR